MEHVERAFTPDFIGSLLGTKVNKVSISMGSNHGDNYMCVLYGIEADLSDGEKRHLVVKTFPCLVARQQMLQMTNMFAKEYYVYDHWFTWFSELQEDLGKPNAFPLAVPKYIAGAAVDYSETPVGSEGCESYLCRNQSLFYLCCKSKVLLTFSIRDGSGQTELPSDGRCKKAWRIQNGRPS